MKVLFRIFAQIIDILVTLIVFVGGYIFVSPILFDIINNAFVAGILFFILAVMVVFALQYPFLKSNQTVGKAFCSLRIETTNVERPITISIIIAREVLLKLMTVYIICLPVLWGKYGGHELSTETKVVIAKRNKNA